MSPAPIGVFDSGVGGLSVAREVRSTLPTEPLLYLADTAFCPYGARPLEEVRARSMAAIGELVRRGVKAVVVACNTATGAALELLRQEFGIPIVGVEPAVKPAAEATRNGRVGVMATSGTLRSDRYHRLVSTYAHSIQVVPVACPGLVELVEAGETAGEQTNAVLSRLLAPLRAARVDTVVLGCTHYPFLRDAVSEIMGPEVRVIDSGRAVARQLERVLRGADALAPSGSDADIQMLTTGDPGLLAAVVERLWGERVRVERVELSTPAAPDQSQLISSGGPPAAASAR